MPVNTKVMHTSALLLVQPLKHYLPKYLCGLFTECLSPRLKICSRQNLFLCSFLETKTNILKHSKCLPYMETSIYTTVTLLLCTQLFYNYISKAESSKFVNHTYLVKTCSL